MRPTTMQRLPGHLYDYPMYYDVLFGSDWRAEFRFLRGCFARHADRPVRRLFEPACGTGRLLFRLARAGYDVAGVDLQSSAVEYCNRRLRRYGFAPAAKVGDMCDFRLSPRADAAFNMINTLRHLSSARQLRAHLECMAGALRRGGLYIIGLHLTPTRGRPTTSEAWSARRGRLGVSLRMSLSRRDRRTRREWYRFDCRVATPTRQWQLAHEVVFRTYTAAQFLREIARVPAFRVEEIYDFSYRIDRPIRLQADTEDVVFVLKKQR